MTFHCNLMNLQKLYFQNKSANLFCIGVISHWNLAYSFSTTNQNGKTTRLSCWSNSVGGVGNSIVETSWIWILSTNFYVQLLFLQNEHMSKSMKNKIRLACIFYFILALILYFIFLLVYTILCVFIRNN